MRLQLTVQRHGLPPMQVLWGVGGLRPPYAAAGASPTISQLLEQINEIVPLESEDWGLEDYAVEVRGFECLHFSELSQILKEDDEVSIRPLQTSDLRFRRLSGRHQISADGKHLIDGVAFGRPYLRRGDRPAIKITPRKRRRLTYGDDEDLGAGEHSQDRQIVIRAGFQNVDNESPDDSEDGEEYDPDEDQGALDEELKDLSEDLQALVEEDEQQYLGSSERALHLDGVGEIRGRLTRSRRDTRGLGLGGASILELTDENGRRYPGDYYNPLLDYYDQDNLVSGQYIGNKRKKRKMQTQVPVAADLAIDTPASTRPGNRRRRSSSASTKNVRFEDGEPRPPNNTPEDVVMDQSEDEDFQPNGLVESGSDGSDKENAKPDMVDSEPSEASSNCDESISTVSSDTDPSESETSSSSSSASSSSNSDSEAELPVKKQQPNVTVHTTEAPLPKVTIAEGTVSTPMDVPVDSVCDASDVQRRKKTRNRNQRRRDRKRLTYLQSIGVLSSAATLTDFKQWRATSQETVHGQHTHESEKSDSKEPDTSAALEATRQALLDSIASGGIGIQPGQPEMPKPSRRGKSVDASASQNLLESKITDTPAAAKSSQETHQAVSGPPRRRAKLDLASSKRLLFGSLGLRTPKTKDDEHSLREKLMSNVKPMDIPRNEQVDDAAANHLSDDDSWKDKIILKAVECCHDGIELSAPPFPFVQRWDPQQQGQCNSRNGRGGKSKKRRLNKQQYEEQEQAQNGESDARFPETLDRREVTDGEPGEDDHEQAVQRDEREGYEGAINDQLMRDANGISATAPDEFFGVDDLPALPDDMSACKSLVPEETVPGTIFAFKQLDMSQDTNWQPKISDYRTATINAVMDNGVLHITLAHRDRPDKVKAYDAQTGKRLYSKFEMPEYEDADVDNDEGVFEIAFADLIEPKLIRAAAAEQIPNVKEQNAVRANTVEAGDGDVSMPEVHLALANGSIEGLADETNDVLDEVEPQEISEAAEKEILKIIKESGFHSDVADGVNIEQGFQSHETPLDPKADEVRDDPNSPTFNGFSSSLPEETTSKQLPSTRNQRDDTSLMAPLGNVEGPSDVDFRSFGSRSPDGDSLTGAVIDEVVLPQLEDDGADFHRPASEDAPEEADHQTSSQELSAPFSPPRTTSEVIRSNGRGSRSLPQPRPIPTLDGTSSDADDLPTLETIYSARTRTVKPFANNRVDKTASTEELPYRKLRSQSVEIKRSSPSFENRLAASQIPAGSQIIDLTLSSDAVDPDGSEYGYKGSDLLDGPGWVGKRRTRGMKTEIKRSAGRSKRTRSDV